MLKQNNKSGDKDRKSGIDAASLAFKKALIERVLGAELSHHLGYEPGGEQPDGQRNCRNGVGHKPLRTDTGAIRLEVPRDRDGRFAPLLVPKHARRFTGFDDKIIGLHARGMTVRESQDFPRGPYAVEAAAEFIGTVTDAVMAEASARQGWPLAAMYPVVSSATAWITPVGRIARRRRRPSGSRASMPGGARSSRPVGISRTTRRPAS